jgi:SAM-dependent methyltransferase
LSCCAKGCDELFNERFARRRARQYRRRGLDRVARRMVGFLEQQGVEGSKVLEIGGGVGEIEVELLKAGAASAVNLELSPAFEPYARELLRETGLEHRAEYRLHDIAEEPAPVEPADVVVLNRVVCCYPDYERLLGAAAARAQRLLVFSYPRPWLLARAFARLVNLAMRARRREFRVYIHRPEAMLAVVEEHGLRPTFQHRGVVWHAAGLTT